MKRNILIYGLLAGVIISINMVYSISLCYTNQDFTGNEVTGYAVMIVVFSLIFFGVRNYRDKQNDGAITFGQAFKMGALIALVASTIYVLVWLCYYYWFVPDFFDQYMAYVLKEASGNGATTTELAEKTKDMEQFREMYKNPFFVFLITYSEILPVGLVVALISAFILKRKKETKEASA